LVKKINCSILSANLSYIDVLEQNKNVHVSNVVIWHKLEYLMSKIYLIELKNNAIKSFWQVTKQYNCYCETKGHFHMSHGLYWTELVRR
jgi:hypothetical protein